MENRPPPEEVVGKFVLDRSNKRMVQFMLFSRYCQIDTVIFLIQKGLLPYKYLEALQKWEKEKINFKSNLGTSDWPGWEELGVNPKPVFSPRPKKDSIGQGLRMRVFERDEFKCRHCGAQKDLSADHVIPESKGGKTELENLQTLCKSCNCKKGGRA